jgi:phosphoribosylanthranilate isomerase
VQEGALVQMARWFGVAEGFVLDHPSSAGGSGLLVDQTCARELAATGPCLLAGGLDPETVASAIRATCPLGVDASSRLESSPGQKDPQRVRDFVRHAQRAFAQQESPS